MRGIILATEPSSTAISRKKHPTVIVTTAFLWRHFDFSPCLSEQASFRDANNRADLRPIVSKKLGGGDKLPSEVSSDSQPKSKVETIVDRRLAWQMAVKIIDLARFQLESLARINRIGAENVKLGSSAINLDLASRYATAAERGLERAVEWFLQSKASGL